MRIALLSNVTVDLLAGMLKNEAEVYLAAGFDTWQQEILMPASGLYASKPEAIVLLLHANAYENTWDNSEKGTHILEEWSRTIEHLSSNLPGVPVLVSSIDISNIRCRYGSEVRLDPYFESVFEEKIVALHNRGFAVYTLPVKDAIDELGRKNFYSPKMWYVGSMPYSMKGLSALHELILRYVSSAKGAKKKCLAVDLDNTLWGGVIGEDGVNGIQLSGHKEGARYKDTQRLLKKMKEQGVMLAILSKNNVEDVEPVFHHPDMILQHEDFVAEIINWEAKPANIRQLAKNLNIGLDAFVFLDDNPAEREQMKAACPEVTVVDFPKDTSLLPEVLAKAYDEYFFSLEVTKEDIGKTAMYRAEAQRKSDLQSSASMEDFLKKLEMKMEIHFMTPDEEKRVTQLTNKTNQFNLTTRRYSEEEIHSYSDSSTSDVITVHMSDKYGDQGLVAVLILKYLDTTAEIDTFLMSCRVMGRNAETEIIAQVKKLLKSKDIADIHAAYIKTAKNAPVLNLYDSLGFSHISGTITEIGDEKEYSASVDALPSPTGVFSEVNANL